MLAELLEHDQVQVVGSCPASADHVWAIAREFCSPWHPLVDTIKAESDARGALIRSFTVKVDETSYREQLTYFSDTDRTFSYTLIEGIEGARNYDARLSVSGVGEGECNVSWTASISADASRIVEIAKGTKKIFELGIASLDAAADNQSTNMAAVLPAPESSCESVVVKGAPTIVASVTPDMDGPLCLFLHGIGGNRQNWHPQLQSVGSVMRTASMDLRGYGDSELGVDQSTVDDYCSDILRLKETLGADQLVLCGLSYGAWIATSFAMRHREHLAGLVLSGGCTGMSEAPQEERNAFLQNREAPLNAGKTPADFAPNVVDTIAGPNAGKDVKEVFRSSMAAISTDTYRDALTCFTNPSEQFDFSQLTMPVLMTTGEFDRLAPPAEIRSIATRIRDAQKRSDVRFEIVFGAGHICNLEAPDLYNRYLLDFLARIPR